MKPISVMSMCCGAGATAAQLAKIASTPMAAAVRTPWSDNHRAIAGNRAT
ncbi:hypothetical protein [Acidovorax carolinensis]|nr:hypothetical protein [Acidovorax carolinensis]